MPIGSVRPLWARQVACASRGTASRSVLPWALRSAVIIGDRWAFRLAVILGDGDPFVRAAILTLRGFREARRSNLEHELRKTAPSGCLSLLSGFPRILACAE